MTNRPRGPRGAGLLVGLVLAFLHGCGEDDGVGTRYPVRGTVTYKGQPVPNGTVSFMTEAKDGRSGGGGINPDGTYEASTVSPGDGLLPGRYKVSVTSVEVDMESVVKKPTGTIYRTDMTRKAPKKKNIPDRYSNPVRSGLTFEVKPESNTYDIPLTD